MNTTDSKECIRRHIRLMRWDLEELRKSHIDTAEKTKARRREEDLVARVSTVFSDEQVRAPGYLEVIRSACAADGLRLDPDDAERIWRAASGAAHGKYWPTVELQHIIPVTDHEPGQHRSVLVPKVDGISEALRAAHDMTQIGVYGTSTIRASISKRRLPLQKRG